MSISGNPLHDILRTAIQREIDAYTLYTNAARMIETPHAHEILKDLAAQEVGHRNKLEALLKGNVFRVISKGQQQKVVDLKITDYLVEEPLSPDSDLQDILIVAGKRESASHNLYASLAKVSDDEATTQLFEYLANEELIHKHRVEALYDEIVYKEN